jgi:hypothetical protein
MNAAVSCDTDALNALEVVAKAGWLSKGAWKMSRAVHSFVKPINVKLTPAVSDAVKAGILSRSTVVKLQLEDNVTLISPLPLALQELALFDTFSEYDKVPELPAALIKLDVTVESAQDATALRRLLECLPTGLMALSLCKRVTETHVTVPDEDLLDDVDCSRLSMLRALSVRGLGGNMVLPSQLHELSISHCCIKSDLHTMASLRQLSLTDCQFKHSSRLVLNEGLVSLNCFRCNSLTLPSVLPSTLQHLEITSNYNVPLGVLPSGLQTLRLGNKFNRPLGTLPQSLLLLKVGMLFDQDLRPLPPLLKHLNLGKLARLACYQ